MPAYARCRRSAAAPVNTTGGQRRFFWAASSPDASTKPTATEAATGQLKWDVTLKPREKREIVYEFTVDWPQERQVSGL